MDILKKIAMWTGAAVLVLLFLGVVDFGFSRIHLNLGAPQAPAHTHPAPAAPAATASAPAAADPTAYEELAAASTALTRAATRVATTRSVENRHLSSALTALKTAAEALKALVPTTPATSGGGSSGD